MKLILTVLCLTIAAQLLQAKELETGSTFTRDKFVPTLNVSDQGVLFEVVALINALLTAQDTALPNSTRKPSERNLSFVFASGTNYIRNGAVSGQAIAMLPQKAIQEITELTAPSNVYYVQYFNFIGGEPFTLGVHNEDGDDPEHVYQCFVATLWPFAGFPLSEYNPAKWRTMYAQLFFE